MPKLEDCKIRELTEDDIEKVLEWRNSYRVRKNMYNDKIITTEEHYAWFARIRDQQKDLCLVFEVQGYPAGLVNLTDIDRINNKCFWGFYLGESDMPPRMGLAMGFLGLEHAFEKMFIRKVTGEVMAFNLASINLHLKLGFSEEGRLAKHILRNGEYVDVISFALFTEDWNVKKKGIKELFE